MIGCEERRERETLSGVTNFRVLEAGPTFLRLSWTAGLDAIQGYRLTYVARGEAQAEEVNLGAGATSFLLSNLRPNTEYVVTLYPLHPRQTIAPAVVSGRTSSLAGVQQLSAQNISSQGMLVAWRGVSGATGYRITWALLSGQGIQQTDTASLPTKENSYTLTGLQPGTEYHITLYTLYDGKEVATPVTISQTDGSEETRRIAGDQSFFDLQDLKDGVTYLVRITTVSGSQESPPATLTFQVDGQERSQLLPAGINTYDIEDLQPGGRYEIRITSLQGSQESEAVSIVATTDEREGQRTLPGSATSYQVSGLRPGERYTFTLRPVFRDSTGAEASVSGTSAQAVCQDARRDIVFLVHATRDSAYNAEEVQGFLADTVSALGQLGPGATQVGIVIYSYRGLPLLLLNRSADLPTVLRYIRSLRYEEPSGNAIGAAINFAKSYMLSASAGRRPGVPGTLVIVADGSSGDDAIGPAREIKAAGIRVLAVGMDGADREQLRRLVTNEDPRNVFLVRDASSLPEVEEELSDALCSVFSPDRVGRCRGVVAMGSQVPQVPQVQWDLGGPLVMPLSVGVRRETGDTQEQMECQGVLAVPATLVLLDNREHPEPLGIQGPGDPLVIPDLLGLWDLLGPQDLRASLSRENKDPQAALVHLAEIGC
ncbi:Collagen alpha-1(VII) chain [Varanus komodoensis]|nr:Collagen alpha-1(VII) chain [Varanus komodoensis]